ncbi:MAG TPA: contractile injection system tape measure protein [Puia sp.]|nr:contractile injection system tape measure protein [Puia sp.]
MQHIIKKQIIQLQLDGKQDAFRIQQLISEYYWKEIIPILQKVFDSISKPGEIIRMDQLEIDLGAISIRDIEQGKWAINLETALKEQLIKFLSQVHKNNELQREPTILSVFRQWLYYMEKGWLPWNVLEVNEAWYEKTLQTLATDFKSVTALRKQVLTNTSFTRRVIAQHNDRFLSNLVETLTAEKQENLPAAIHELYEIFYLIHQKGFGEKIPVLPVTNKKDFLKRIWEIILLASSKNEISLKTETLIEKILAVHTIEAGVLKKVRKDLARKLEITRPILKKLTEEEKNKWIKSESEGKNTNKKNTDQKKQSTVTNPEQKKSDKPQDEKKYKQPESKPELENKANRFDKNDESPPINPLINQKIPHKQDQPDCNDAGIDNLIVENEKIRNLFADLTHAVQKSTQDSIDDEGVFARHAGIILLHPFLNSFFKRLEMVHDKEFANLMAHQKALHLLYYLSTGQKHPDEYELVIAKVLCAYPLQQPVETDIELTEMELNEANDLLIAAIAQWEVLKNSSAAALREGFLQRNGKLFSKSDKLYLQVEKSAIDVLLDRLPWNLSMIKLPWMNEMLRVEWR